MSRSVRDPNYRQAGEGGQPVMMRFEICVPVLPAYVQHYLDDGWTIADE